MNIEAEQNIQKMNERFEAKKREEILVNVPKEFEEKVNKALDYENDEDYEKVAEICHEILGTETGKDIEQVKIILARVYPKLLKYDVVTGNKKYQADMTRYIEFLDSLNMNNLMQEYIVETLARLCELLENEWYRPLFREFINTIEEKQYLTNEIYKQTITSAYASLESSIYYGDSRLSMMMKNALKYGYDRNYTVDIVELESVKKSMMIDILSSDYYITKYYDSHKDEFKFVKKEYPYSYALIKDVVDAVKKDRDKKAEECLDALMEYVAEGIDKEKLKAAMDASYNKLLSKEAKSQAVHSGKSTYYRTNDKIGRNDECPCGSGKKYKYCCGKHI